MSESEAQSDRIAPLRERLLDDSGKIIIAGIDQDIIAAFEERHYEGTEHPPLHGRDAVYFLVTRSSSRHTEGPTSSVITLFFRQNPQASHTPYAFLSLSIGPDGRIENTSRVLDAEKLSKINELAKNRLPVSSKMIQDAVNSVTSIAARKSI